VKLDTFYSELLVAHQPAKPECFIETLTALAMQCDEDTHPEPDTSPAWVRERLGSGLTHEAAALPHSAVG
jgi:hypothetical protein